MISFFGFGVLLYYLKTRMNFPTNPPNSSLKKINYCATLKSRTYGHEELIFFFFLKNVQGTKNPSISQKFKDL